ncbi:MAG: hypothetical protein GTN89_04905 [Acidobacteria bacterium]|nr:hypothetical protein [Acidobacteriota bacterium]NIM60693.1 hypothetical protein [Acidobacteriota bacterium]NIO58653.1 hypothetical protein [Acidobacteriota bacterium]NIQ29709.1 hypothetical protein [Acidobacteriota bacterium]NIQ84426.1 hypothetical protein [Acidobacteriota bacterium]
MPVDPSNAEDEYFAREEIERLRKARAEANAKLAEETKAQAKELHWMHCPKCGMELTEVEYRGVQVDNCFSCGGMFLDAGEAEKILAFEEPGALGKMFGYFVGKD